MNLSRATELRRLIGSAGCYPQPVIKPATPEEHAEIMAMWKRMPGSSCYYSAICCICNEFEAEHARYVEAELMSESHESLEAMSSMFDDLADGSFYKKQEESGFTIKYIN